MSKKSASGYRVRFLAGLLVIILGIVTIAGILVIIPGVTVGNCDNLSIVGFSSSSNTLQQGTQATLSGTYGLDSSCNFQGNNVYFWYTNPNTGQLSTGQTVVDLGNTFSESLGMPSSPYTGTILITASACPENNQAGCSGTRSSNGMLTITITSSIVNTFSATFQFDNPQNGSPVNGVVMTVSQGSNVLGTVTSSDGGYSIFKGLASGSYTYSYVAGASAGYSYQGSSGQFQVLTSNYNQLISLTVGILKYYSEIQFTLGGNPVSGASVEIFNGTQLLGTFTTNSSGYVSDYGFSNGGYSVTVLGTSQYNTFTQSYSVTGGNAIETYPLVAVSIFSGTGLWNTILGGLFVFLGFYLILQPVIKKSKK